MDGAWPPSGIHVGMAKECTTMVEQGIPERNGQVLVIGEALIDIVRRPGQPDQEHPGGSPANVALGLARLGQRASLLTRIGDDARGRSIADHLGASGVLLVDGSVTAESTSTAAALIGADGSASYEFDLDWRLPAAIAPAGFDVVHTGSIAAFLQPGGDQVLDLIRSAHAQASVTYDPNARPRLMGEPGSARTRVEALVALSDVVKVSDEDLAWFAPGEDPVAVATTWVATGPAIVIITRGARGVTAITSRDRVDVMAPTIEVIDTVGAGDSFMGAVIDHLLRIGLLGPGTRTTLDAITTEEIHRLLAYGAEVAAVTCSRAGANPPTRTELGHSWARSALSPVTAELGHS